LTPVLKWGATNVNSFKAPEAPVMKLGVSCQCKYIFFFRSERESESEWKEGQRERERENLQQTAH